MGSNCGGVYMDRTRSRCKVSITPSSSTMHKSLSKGDRSMDHGKVTGLKVAILVEDGFERVELVEPRKALDQAGAETRIVSPKDERVRSWNFTDWGEDFPVDIALDRAQPDDFDALLLP